MSISFIAEVSSNHSRDLNRCLDFIDASAEVGCSAVKFQLFRVRELFSPEALQMSKTLADKTKFHQNFFLQFLAVCL